MPELEDGPKWWIRYVIVPLLGGGGLIAIIVALIGRGDSNGEPDQPPALREETQVVVTEGSRHGLDIEQLPGTIRGLIATNKCDFLISVNLTVDNRAKVAVVTASGSAKEMGHMANRHASFSGKELARVKLDDALNWSLAPGTNPSGQLSGSFTGWQNPNDQTARSMSGGTGLVSQVEAKSFYDYTVLLHKAELIGKEPQREAPHNPEDPVSTINFPYIVVGLLLILAAFVIGLKFGRRKGRPISKTANEPNAAEQPNGESEGTTIEPDTAVESMAEGSEKSEGSTQ